MDELQQLLALMGATSFAEGVTVLTTVNTVLDASQAALGTRGTAATLSALSARSNRLAALERASGKEGEEADGVLRAALTSHAELPKLQSRVAELEKNGQASALAGMFAEAEKAGKLTPAIRQNVQAAFDAGDITLKGAESWLANLLPVKALEQRLEAAPPANATPGSVQLTHNGKKWEEMTGLERVALYDANRDLYNAMRASAQG